MGADPRVDLVGVRVLQIGEDVTVTVQDLTITKGRATGSNPDDDSGGGISNDGCPDPAGCGRDG